MLRMSNSVLNVMRPFQAPPKPQIDRPATYLKFGGRFCRDRQRPRDRLRDRLGVGTLEPVKPAAARIFLEIDTGERDAVRVLDSEGLGRFADPQRQSVGRGRHFSADSGFDHEPTGIMGAA